MAGLDLSISNKVDNNNSLVISNSSDMDVSPAKSMDSPISTPRKNKRKSSSPKRRTDFSIKRLCPEIPPALNLDTEEPLSRPGYGEHPPSTPETSASSSTPSPPDATELRIPHVARRSALTSPRRHALSSPSRSRSPPRTDQQLANQQLVPPFAPAFLPINPLLLQHMVGLRHPGAHPLPFMLHHQQMTSGTHHASTPRLNAPPAQSPVHTSHHSAASTQPFPRSHTSTSQHPNPVAMTASSTSRQSHAQHRATNKTPSKAVPVGCRARSTSSRADVSTSGRSNTSTLSTSHSSEPSFQSDSEEIDSETGKKRKKFNYKNMTRERRIEANARERSRVHTISAAFETLRRTVPAFSHNQRLSKLAILRIACSYISSLATLAGHDYSSEDSRQMSFEDSVNQCTKTIQNEGRAKRRH